MRKTFLLTAFFALFAITVQAQCDKKFKLKIERVYTLQEDGSEGEEVPFTADATISKDSILLNLVTPDGATIEITCKNTSTDCKMNADYTDGTIEWKSDAVMNSNGQSRDAKMLFKLEAKEGKLKLIGWPEESPTEKICFLVKEKEAVK